MNTPPKIRFYAMFLLASCALGSHTLAADSPEPKVMMVFESLAGDFSDIKLSLKEDHTFALEMYFFDENKNYVMAGNWSQDAQTLKLSFTYNKPDIEALFAEPMIVDEETFVIELNSQELWIWDTLCTKIAPEELVACD